MSTRLLLLVLFSGFGVVAEPRAEYRIGPGVLRSQAIVSPMPTYPKESLRAKATGVVSLTIFVSGDGSVARVNVLAAPDDYIKANVRDTMSQWTFTPFVIGGKRSSVEARYVFHFTIVEGGGRVIDLALEKARLRKKGV
jgi:TonB family protein